MLVIRGVSHRFGKKVVLSGIDLEVKEGEIVAVMGASGGGKTTLLRCISGLIQPTEGAIEVDGVNVAKEPERARRSLGLVFQSSALFDYLNVEDNVAFGVRRQEHLTAKQASERACKTLELVQLTDANHLMPSELSGGMKKRVGLARALAMEPKLLLYDEPTSGLDPVTAYSIDQLIADTRDRLGVTSVVVSHDVSSVLRVADRIAFLEAGRLTFVGTSAEFRESPNAAINELVGKARSETLSDARS